VPEWLGESKKQSDKEERRRETRKEFAVVNLMWFILALVRAW
jgi:hypothetical protein